MPAQPDDLEPTDADLDLVLEDATGKPVKPANLAAGVASMRDRITQLEAEKIQLLLQLEAAAAEDEDGFRNGLAAINRDLAIARKRLLDYEAQLGMQN